VSICMIEVICFVIDVATMVDITLSLANCCVKIGKSLTVSTKASCVYTQYCVPTEITRQR
jgi:hypothetical protein